MRVIEGGMCPADQVRHLGLQVGDTIIGREQYGRSWHEAKLTLLWFGQTEAAWMERERSSESPGWSEPEEAVNWTLDCREWRKE